MGGLGLEVGKDSPLYIYRCNQLERSIQNSESNTRTCVKFKNLVGAS